MPEPSDDLHTTAAAEHLGVAQNTIRKWAARGDVLMHRNPVNGNCFFEFSCDKLRWCCIQG
jgi:predicted site-specific integrase-resolvase